VETLSGMADKKTDTYHLHLPNAYNIVERVSICDLDDACSAGRNLQLGTFVSLS
jgi:hypothetical protein